MQSRKGRVDAVSDIWLKGSSLWLRGKGRLSNIFNLRLDMIHDIKMKDSEEKDRENRLKYRQGFFVNIKDFELLFIVID